jgi:hypothetical protein
MPTVADRTAARTAPAAVAAARAAKVGSVQMGRSER